MDLQTILSHRNECLICGGEMRCFAPEYPTLLFRIDESGMRINSGHTKHGIRMHFGFDGKYTKTRQNYKIYREPISIIRQCDYCRGKSNKSVEFTNVPRPLVKLKSRLAGLSMAFAQNQIDNLKSKECAYRFQIMGDAEGNYDCSLNYELLRYHNKNAFWHVDTSYVTETSILHHARFKDTVEDILTLKIPAVVNLSGVKDIDQFLSKFKMYMLMS